MLRIGFKEVELRDKVKQAGGRWLTDEKLWQLSHQQTVALGLEERIVKLIEPNEIPF